MNLSERTSTLLSTIDALLSADTPKAYETAQKYKSELLMLQDIYTWLLSLTLSKCWTERENEENIDRCPLHIFITNDSGHDFDYFSVPLDVMGSEEIVLETITISASNWHNKTDHEFIVDVDGKCEGLFLDTKNVNVSARETDKSLCCSTDKDLVDRVANEKEAFFSILDKGISTVNNKALISQLLCLRGHAIKLFNYITENPSLFPHMRKLCTIYGPVLDNAINTYTTGINSNTGAELINKTKSSLSSVIAAGINRMQTIANHLYAGDVTNVETDLEVIKYML